MSLREVSKAVVVVLLLFALSSLLVIAQPQSPRQAYEITETTLVEAGKEPAPTSAEMSLPLRLKIDPRVLKAFDATVLEPDRPGGRRPQVRYLVHLAPKADLSSVVSMADVTQKRYALVEALQRKASESQAGLQAYLEAQRASGAVTAFTSFWIFNGLAVTSDLETLWGVAARPEVEMIRPDRVHQLPPVSEGQDASLSGTSIEWNISKIGADRVWNAFGLRGQGVVVANMDSGVDWTHAALQRKYRGYDSAEPTQSRHDYNWFDATQTYPTAPGDGDGHGTHTMGTLVGSLPNGQNQVGVAPEARWIAVKVFDDTGKAYDSWIHAGFQWILAPTDLSGQNPDPALAPDICSNSWGDTDGSLTTFWEDVQVWRAAGIFSAFAIGNKYQSSLAPHSPGTFPHAFAVGATDSNDAVASFSCRGPSPWNEIKPEVSAPGVDVRSTLPDNQYDEWNGTSMATPHVAGVAALLHQAYRQYSALPGASLTITATEQIITSTAQPLPDAASVPNNDYGWGRVDAYQAVGSIAQGGEFWGRVTDSTTGAGISGAMITMVNERFGGSSRAWTDPQGYYTFSVAAGVYDVTAAQFYYAPRQATAVEIIARATTQLDFRLLALPAGSVVGRVAEADTSQPVTATVRTIERSVEVRTDAGGYYTLTLPLGHYVLEAVPVVAGHKIDRATVIVETEDQTLYQNFDLAVIPKILLVDADAWVTAGTIEYYRRSLETLLYSYDTWFVDRRSPAGVGNFPPAATLKNYDVVVWAQALSSPGYVGAWPALGEYLEAGKALLISGQDIGFWDVQRGYGEADYESFLHAEYIRDDSGTQDIAGLDEAFLDGITLTLGTDDSARNQVDPSEVAPLDIMATPIVDYVDNEGDGHAGLAVHDCRGYRAVYFAFGLEGAGPEAARTETLRRILDWLVEPRADYGLSLAVPVRKAAGAPTSELVFDFAILNTGLRADAYVVAVEGNGWPATIWDATQNRPITTTAIISPCSTASLMVRVEIPDDAVTGQTEDLTLSVRSQAAPSAQQVRHLRGNASMPWAQLPPLPTARYRMAAAAAPGACGFFVIGGWGVNDQALATNEMYDLQTRTWQAMASKPTATANTAAVEMAGKVYVPGGMRGETHLSVLEIYDLETNTWAQGTDLPRPVSGLAVAAANGKLYVFGGSVGGGTLLDTALEYDATHQEWREKAPLPSGPRAYAAATEVDGKVYVAGGWPALRTFERYDPEADSWTALAPLPTGRHSLGLVAADGQIYAVGGGDSWTGLAAVERYDPGTDSWTTMSQLDSRARAGAGAVTLVGRIFTLGGTDQGDGTGAAHEALAVGPSLSDSSVVAEREVASAGDELAYTVILRNPGQRTIERAMVLDDIPAHATYVQGSVRGGATYNASAKRIEWQGSMPARSSKAFGFRVALAEGLPRGTPITNTARVDDGLCGEQPISAVTTIETADLSRSHKAVDKPIAPGGAELSYLIELSNIGAFTATDVTLVDPLPTYLEYVPGSVVGGSYNAALDQVEWSGVVQPGAEGSYRWRDSDSGGVAYEWVDATVDGESVPGGDDRSLGPFDIGFPFTFYGTEYTEFYVNTNGQVLFGAGSSAYSNVGIPSASTPNNFIAAFWDDLVSEEGTMYYKLEGATPSRRLVIEWAGVRRFSGSNSLTFEVILYEGSNRMLVQYDTLDGTSVDGESATVGIEDGEGAEGVQYQHNGSGPGYPLHAGLAVLFEPSVKGHAIHFRARVLPEVPLNTLITNEALLSLGGQPAVPLTATTWINRIDLSNSHLLVDQTEARAGEQLVYTMLVQNSGNVTAPNVRLIDPIPAGVSYVQGSLTEGAIYNSDDERIEWQGPVPAGAAVPISFTVATPSDAPHNTHITNTATLDDGVGNVVTPTVVTILGSYDLAASDKVMPVYARPEEVVTCTIRLRNTGIVPASVALTDAIPIGTVFMPGSLWWSSGQGSADSRVVTWVGDVVARGVVIVRFQVQIGAQIEPGTQLLNTVSIEDPLGNVFERSATTTVFTGPPPWLIYLPVVLEGYPPDLVASGSAIGPPQADALVGAR